jgi:hypothetical protein
MGKRVERGRGHLCRGQLLLGHQGALVPARMRRPARLVAVVIQYSKEDWLQIGKFALWLTGLVACGFIGLIWLGVLLKFIGAICGSS